MGFSPWDSFSSAVINRPHDLFCSLSPRLLVVLLEFYAAYCTRAERQLDGLT